MNDVELGVSIVNIHTPAFLTENMILIGRKRSGGIPSQIQEISSRSDHM